MLTHILDRASQRFPYKTALIYKGRKYTYSELAGKVRQLAHGLLRAGLKPGDQVAFYLNNSPELIIGYFACLKAGLCAVPIPNFFRSHEIKGIFQYSVPKILITNESAYAAIADLAYTAGVERIYLAGRLTTPYRGAEHFINLYDQGSDVALDPEMSSHTQAMINYTSGTTGNSKGIVRTHRQLEKSTANFSRELNYEPTDNVLIWFSLSHVYCFSMQLLPAFYTGATVVLMPAFEPETALNLIESEQISVICSSPSLCQQLVDAAKLRPTFKHHLRLCVVGGDVLSQTTYDQFKQQFGIALCNHIGQTETLAYAFNFKPEQGHPLSLGQPINNAEIRIIDANGRSLIPYHIGEIAVKSDGVLDAYVGDSQPRAELFVGDWLRTGDLGYFDRDGQLWFTGRMKDAITVQRGHKVFPVEIETVCRQHAAIYEACVVGCGTADYGQALQMMVVPRPDTMPTPQELLSFLADRLAEYKIPRSVSFLKELPKTAAGKLDRRQATALVAASLL